MGSDYNILVMGHGRLWQDAKGNIKSFIVQPYRASYKYKII